MRFATNQILQAFENVTGVTPSDMLTRGGTSRRNAGMTGMRTALCYLLREHTTSRLSYPEIAKILWISSHSTVIDALRRYEAAPEDYEYLVRPVLAEAAGVEPDTEGHFLLRGEEEQLRTATAGSMRGELAKMEHAIRNMDVVEIAMRADIIKHMADNYTKALRETQDKLQP